MKILKEIIPYIIILFVVVLVRTYIVTPIIVNGASMNNTLKNGEYLLLEKYDHDFNRFDIVVFNYNGERLIKRIIGLPGEHIRFEDNKLYINNVLVKEAYGSNNTVDFELEEILELGLEVIPEDSYFVMGDNRINSTDSRFIGPVKSEIITGKVEIRLFPFNRMGLID
jgi:signal peptidase I